MALQHKAVSETLSNVILSTAKDQFAREDGCTSSFHGLPSYEPFVVILILA